MGGPTKIDEVIPESEEAASAWISLNDCNPMDV
jgi:hypothetical protein